MTSLRGRTVLLTGATGAIGSAIAEAYGRAGARLLLSSRREDALQALTQEFSRRHNVEAAAIACDLADPDSVRALSDKALERFGKLDILVNAAGAIGPIGPASENDAAEWNRTIQVNLCAAAQLCRSCVPHMPRDGGRGKIVNLSGGGAASPRPRFSAYAAAKAALVRFSETLADEVRERAIDVNCVAPGLIRSSLTDAVVNAGSDRAGDNEYDAAAHATDANLARAVDLCVFLASPASDGITGKLLHARWDPWPSLAEHRADLDGTDLFTLRRIVPRDRRLDWGTT